MTVTWIRSVGVAFALLMSTHMSAADTSDDFGWFLIAEVNEGADLGAVDAMVAEILDAASGNTGTLVFNFARVGNTIYGYELFDNQVAFFEHFSRVEHLVPSFLELWTPNAIIPTHDLPEQIDDIMQQMGAVLPDLAAHLVH
jgi:hypothetical protein